MREMWRALRSVRQSVGFSLVVVAILAAGIGANTTLFTVIDKVLLHPVSIRDADRMVELTAFRSGNIPAGSSREEFDFYAKHVRAFEATGMWEWQSPTLTGVDDPENVFGLEVSEQVFPIAGVAPELGRTFRAEEFEPSSPPVVIISDRLWRRHLRGDPGAIGRQILLDGKGYTVIGIMGPDFVLSQVEHQFWIPYPTSRIGRDDLRHWDTLVAKLRPGVRLAEAQREVEAVTAGLPARADGKRPAGWHMRLRPLTEQYTAPYRRALLILWGAVGLVLLIACANAANLLLARASGRRREFALRASLGASAGRLMREILAESTALSIAAGAAGVVLAAGMIRLLAAWFPTHSPVPQLDRIAINVPVLLVTWGLAVVTALLCAIPACMALRRLDLTETLNGSSRTAAGSAASSRARSILAGMEVALSLTLLVGAGLMVHSLERLLRVHLGFEPQHVFAAKVPAPPQVKEKSRQVAYFSRMLGAVRAIPGVRAAAITNVLPLGGLQATTSLAVEGYTPTVEEQRHPRGTHLRSISTDYFSTMGIPLLRGRAFDDRDTASSPRVVIVSDALARHYWPGQDPIGKHVSVKDHPQPDEWATVAGVVEAVKHRGLAADPEDEVYFPYTQLFLGPRYATLVVRGRGDPLALAPAIRKRIHEMAPDQPVAEVTSMEELVMGSAAEARFHTLLLEMLAGLALGLAVTGVFAVISYMVTQRTREIGIRSALGASPGAVVRFVFGLAMRPVLVGAGCGLAGGVAGARLLRSELFETPVVDPVVLAAVVMLLIASAGIAAAVPAWRAARIDAVETLRAE